MPPEMSTTNQLLRLVQECRENLLREYEQRFEDLPEHDK